MVSDWLQVSTQNDDQEIDTQILIPISVRHPVHLNPLVFNPNVDAANYWTPMPKDISIERNCLHEVFGAHCVGGYAITAYYYSDWHIPYSVSNLHIASVSNFCLALSALLLLAKQLPRICLLGVKPVFFQEEIHF